MICIVRSRTCSLIVLDRTLVDMTFVAHSITNQNVEQECLSALCRALFMNDINSINDHMLFTNQLGDTVII